MKVIRACDVPAPDTSYFLPWSLDMLYQVEPELREIADRTVIQKQRQVYDRFNAYSDAKNAAGHLVGWYARDPRLRSQEAWDCYFKYILDELSL